MRLLLDECVDRRVQQPLQAAGHDVVLVRDWHRAALDEAVLAYACNTQRVLVTLDNDFGKLAIVEKQPHCGILRLVGFHGSEEAEGCLAALRRYGLDLERGCLVVFEPDKSRVRE